MNDFFATIYETWFGIFNGQYDLIFTTLYTDGGYINFGLTFFCIPLLFLLLFYFVWRYPYGKWWHWLIWLLGSSLLVLGATLCIANTEIFGSNNEGLIYALSNPGSGYNEFASSLPIKYASINFCLALLIGCIYSILMKQFSKIQMHLPF